MFEDIASTFRTNHVSTYSQTYAKKFLDIWWNFVPFFCLKEGRLPKDYRLLVPYLVVLKRCAMMLFDLILEFTFGFNIYFIWSGFTLFRPSRYLPAQR